MPTLEVHHTTIYTYRRPVELGEHRLMLRPRDSADQRLLAYLIDITPKPSTHCCVHDVFGNCVEVVNFAEPARALKIQSRLRIDHSPALPVELPVAGRARTYPFSYDDEEFSDLRPAITRRYRDRGQVARWAKQFIRSAAGVDTYDLLAAMAHATREGFTYARREEMGTQTPAETLRLRSGSCRDFAVLMMEAARSLGLAARFVSGYLNVHAGATQTNRGGGSTHAWVEVYIPGAGWVEFDPTNDILGNRDLIRVAVARDAHQAVPVSGTFAGAASDFIGLHVDVQIGPASECVRPEPAARAAA